MSNWNAAVAPRFVHTRSRRRRARGFAAVANQNAQLAQSLGKENAQLKQQLKFMKLALLQRPYNHSAQHLHHHHPGRLYGGFAKRFMGNPQSLMMASVLGATGALTAMGGRRGLPHAARAFSSTAAYQSYGDARFNVFQMFAYNQRFGF